MTEYPMPTNLGDLLSRAGINRRGVLVDLREAGCPQAFTALELDEKVRAFARGLIRTGIGQGESVGFLAANRWELLVGYLGTMYMGAVAVPINYKFPAETINHIVRDSSVRCLFVDQERLPLAPANVRQVGMDDERPGGFAAFLDEGPLDAFAPAADHIAEILYTSGSTGMPKGVPLTHAGQLWAASHYMEPINEADEQRTSLIVAPLYHMNGLFFCTICLLNGMRIVLQPQFKAEEYIKAAAEYSCTFLSGVPTMFALVAALGKDSLPKGLDCVKKVMIGSAPLSDALLTMVREMFPEAAISNGYGSTEAGPAIFGPHPGGKPTPPLAIGFPFDGVEWRLRDGISPDEGVLEVRTPALTPGYLNRPEADRERFVDGWFNSNDIMRHDKDGYFYFISRADDMFVCGGENIYPGEVEELLNRHPAVQQSLVVGAPDDLKGRVPIAFVVPVDAGTASEAEIKTFALEQGAAYAHPRRIIFKTVLPVGGTHKVDRKALEREAASLMVGAGRATTEKGVNL